MHQANSVLANQQHAAYYIGMKNDNNGGMTPDEIREAIAAIAAIWALPAWTGNEEKHLAELQAMLRDENGMLL